MIKRWLSRIGTLFLYLLSLMPFWLLYLLSDFLFVVLYYVTGYRRKVVQENLKNAFPEKSTTERGIIERKYYKYLADLVVETVKAISISDAEIVKRMTIANPEVIQHYFNRDKSIIAAAGHYCNWEWAALRSGLATDEKSIIVYKPLSNTIVGDFFNKTRGRFGVIMVSMKQTYRKMTEFKNDKIFVTLLSDQAPVREDSKYFTDFLNQPTAVFLGVEKLTRIIDGVIIFIKIELVKRGYYKATIVPLVDEPKQTKPFEITEIHVKYLESIIKEKPEYWLWSHRRWKIKPEEVH
jgi:KDO2-lipid IV(A) lauroyltransferase